MPKLTPELKPCQFCGAKCVNDTGASRGTYYFVLHKKNCLLYDDSEYSYFGDDIVMWNRRSA